MREKLLSILALTILVTSTLVGCSGESSTPSTLTILSITEGDVFVMKAGTDTWTEAQAGMSLGVGDTIKTGGDSGAEITFFDGSTVELEAGTQIEITSLDSSPDTGTRTITLMQTIGTTISRVTKLLDPASSYDVETPTGVAAVRGSTLIVTILEDGPTQATQICNVGGDIWGIAQGVQLDIPEGRCAIIRLGQPPELIPLNSSPVAISDSVVTDADSSVTVYAPGVLSNDSDPDGDTLAVTALNTSGTVGTVTAWDVDGSFTYDPNGQFQYLPAGNSTSDSFSYTVSDGNSGTDTATVTVVINGVYDPPIYYPPVYYPPVNYPPVAVDDGATTPQNTQVTINVLANDSDPDGDTLTVNSVTQGAHGSVTKTSSNVTYTPALNFTGADSLTYTITDGHGGTDTATVSVTVTSSNHPPVAVNDATTTDEDNPITTAAPGVLDNDSDPDIGDTLTVTAVDTNGTVGAVAWYADGAFTYNPNGQFESLSAGNSTTDSFTYTVSDGHGGTDTATVTITIDGVNDTPGNSPPTAANDAATTDEDTPISVAAPGVLINDSDPDGDTLVVTALDTTGTVGTVTTWSADGSFTYDPNAKFEYLQAGNSTTDSFSYTVSDGYGGTDTATVTITINGVSDTVETSATLNIQIDTNAHAPIYVQDTTTGALVTSGNVQTSASIEVAGGHSYCVWLGGNVTYYVKHITPTGSGWEIAPDGQTACGFAAANTGYNIHFTSQPPS